MNNNVRLKALIGTEIILLVLLAGLFIIKDIISIPLIVCAAIILIPLYPLVVNYVKKENEVNEEAKSKALDLSTITVNRTKEGTAFEIACGILLLAIWIIALTTGQFDIIVLKGKHIAMIIVTIVVIAILVGCYFPSYCHKWTNTSSPLTNIHQVELSLRAARVIALELTVFILAMVASHEGAIFHTLAKQIYAIIIFVTTSVFSYIIRKAA